MSHNNTVISQVLKLVGRHEFERLQKQEDKPRKKGALTRWSQFVQQFGTLRCRFVGVESPYHCLRLNC